MAGDEQAIRSVISKHFGSEVAYKENELQKIEDRIQLAKMMLHRLRLGILSQQYGLSGFYLMEDYSKENVGVQASWKSFENDFLNLQQEEEDEKEQEEEARQAVRRDETSGSGGKRESEEARGREVLLSSESREGSTPDLIDIPGSLSSSVQSSQVPSEAGEDDIESTTEIKPLTYYSSVNRRVSSLLNDLRTDSPSSNRPSSSVVATKAAASSSGDSVTILETRTSTDMCEPGPGSLPLPARFASKKRVIVGNTSQFLDRSSRSTINGSTHKWMVYVRGPSKEADISSYVKAVRFFLHPSYHPNDIIRISKPPFHLTRYGWGEFPVRVQLEFTDKRNKHVDIIHNLVLDRTHTGHQTLGSETVVDLDLVSTSCDLAFSVPDPTSSTSSSGTGPKKNNSVHPFSGKSFNDINRDGKRHSAEPELEESAAAAGIHPEKIHHIFIPALSTVDQVHLDHSYAQIVIVSKHPKTLSLISTTTEGNDTTAESKERNDDSKNYGEEVMVLDDYLHSVVKTVPLCGPESNSFYLVAPSVDHFRKWNIGRRRASEWIRALTIKRVIQSMEPSVVAASSVTTKQVMEWCRRNGYTPLDPVSSSSRGFCKYCGCLLSRCSEDAGSGGGGGGSSEVNSHPHCLVKIETLVEEDKEAEETGTSESSGSDSDDMEEEVRTTSGQKWHSTTTTKIGRHFSTLSDPFELFELLATKTKMIQQLQEKQVRDQEVDVVSLPHSGQRQVYEGVPRFRVPQTPELKWVQQTAAAIGIRIFPAVIDHMYAHVVEHMIYMACTKFARVIMDRAITESAQETKGECSSSNERCIVPLHIYHAVKSLDSCDFLTNAYMGVPLTPEEPPPSPLPPPPPTTDIVRTHREE